MRKIVKEFNVYNFDELSDDVKKKLIEKEQIDPDRRFT